jgi:hypothetical protein
VIGGFPIYKEAWENFIKRRMTMELSMTIALLSALAIGQIFTAIVIGSHFSDHAQSHRNNRRDHRCCGLRSCGRYAAGNCDVCLNTIAPWPNINKRRKFEHSPRAD